MFGIDDLKKTRFAQELIEEAKKQGITEGKIQGITEGKIQGITEGKIQGITEGKLQAVPRLAIKGFSDEEIADILQLNVEQVRKTIIDLN